MEWLAEHRGLRFGGYHQLWAWSVDDLEGFWSSIWGYFNVHGPTPYGRPLDERTTLGARWFGGELTWASCAL